jgi:N-acetylglucosamine-6-phosphate deacetylase
MEFDGVTFSGNTIQLNLQGGKIQSFEILTERPDPAAEDGDRIVLSPGFIDIQVNGFAGVDFNHENFRPGQMEAACRAMLPTGVTGFFATLVTNSYAGLRAGVEKILEARAMSPLVAHMVKGIHIEGPHISREDGARGAHALEHVAAPNPEEFQRLHQLSQGLIKLVTLAPELPGAPEFIKCASKLGVVTALGHCAPEPEDIQEAVGQGAAMSTHLGNGAHNLLPRTANHIQVQLAQDSLMASIICDGHHLPGYFIKNLLRAKGHASTILITDATAAAAALPGIYTLGGLEVEAGTDGVLRLPGTPYLAGSTLTMDRAISNCARAGEIGLEQAVEMATAVPARLFPGIGGSFEPGQPADFIRMALYNEHLEVIESYIAGRLEYKGTP